MTTVELGLEGNSCYLVLLKTILRAFYKTCCMTIHISEDLFLLCLYIYDLFSGIATSLNYVVTNNGILSNVF